jgi:hypothetical protein
MAARIPLLPEGLRGLGDGMQDARLDQRTLPEVLTREELIRLAR